VLLCVKLYLRVRNRAQFPEEILGTLWGEEQDGKSLFLRCKRSSSWILVIYSITEGDACCTCSKTGLQGDRGEHGKSPRKAV
jgi:hypothetical protein